MTKKVILIHANCRNPSASGDFAFAGSMAKDLVKILNGRDIDVYLVSALDGIPRYEKLYGKAEQGRILVNGVNMGLSSLETFDAVEHTVIAFIDAHHCKYSSSNSIKRVISPETKFLYIGNVNSPSIHDPLPQSMIWQSLIIRQPGLYHFFDRQDMLIGAAGLGSGRFGLSTIDKTVDLPALSDEQTAQLPTGNYGFIYLAALECKKECKIIAQYMQLTRFGHYILVGDFSTAKRKIKRAYQEAGHLERSDDPLEATVDYYDSVPNPIMRRMVANTTGPLVVSSGVMSTLEAMRDNKLTFNQDLPVNEHFVASYLMAVKNIALNDTAIWSIAKLIIDLSILLFAPKPLNDVDMRKIDRLLQMSSVSSRLIAANQTILENASGHLASRLFGFIFSERQTQDQAQLAQVCMSLRKPGEKVSPVDDRALRRAACWGRLFELKVLIRAMDPEDLNKVDTVHGMNALHFAVKYKQIDCASELIKAGVHFDIQDKNGKTVLWWAVNNADRAMITLLIDSGVNVSDEFSEDEQVYFNLGAHYKLIGP